MPIIKLSDYKILDYFAKHVDLFLDLTKDPVESRAISRIEPNPEVSSRSTDLQLHCENMELTAVLLNGQSLSSEKYELKDNLLIIKNVPQDTSFIIETSSRLGLNTDLFGYYETEGTGLVKAETEGMRRVFPCLDRPDNLSTYTTTIKANKDKFPTLLANGVLKSHKILSDTIIEATWDDPIPKPTYLFAMVAGTLTCASTSHKTLPIHFYVPQEAVAKCVFAQNVLKAAMAWDEERFGLECPLSQYMVAGVNKYASGASEPLGLNLFNTANLYATPASRTDMDIIRVMDVVSHEYFHTWTGDLVTIRDWFNLAAKEGLTTFRASLFIEHVLGFDPEHLFDSRSLDKLAPRPDSYTAVRSLYTSAAYEKSSEIFRMIMNVMGEEMFNKGLTAFLKEHQGQAVTLEIILESLSLYSGEDVRPFLSWFTESEIPHVTVTSTYDESTQTYSLEFIATEARERPIPIHYALFSKEGPMIGTAQTLILDKPKMVLEFPQVPEAPIPSLLRGFSAPITIEFPYSIDELLVLMRHDTDIYNRCRSAKLLMTRLITEYCAGTPIPLNVELVTTYLSILLEPQLKTWILAELLTIPSEETLIARLPQVDFEKIAEARLFIQHELAQQLKAALINKLAELNKRTKTNDVVLFDMDAAGNRRLKAVCYAYLLQTDHDEAVDALIKQFESSLGQNMTETISALVLLADANYSQLNSLLLRFYERWEQDIDAINYWLILQASAHSPTVVERVKSLMSHPSFDIANPNKVIALLGAFIRNPYGFHALSGEGYQLVADAILKIEKLNPSLAANLMGKFNGWKKYDKKRQEMMVECLRFIRDHAVTADVRNMVNFG